MLDAYPRSDTLATWGYDNNWFTEALGERGFDVASESHTNYPHTALVLPTMFHMSHVEDIEVLRSVPDRLDLQRRALRTSLENPPALQRLSELGYATVSAGHPADYITLDTAAYPDAGFNVFEHQVLVRTSLVGPTLPLVLNAQRQHILDALAAAPILAEDPAATFMFAHILSPHTPFLFDRNGEVPSVPCEACRFALHVGESGMTNAEFRRAYADQVHYLNGLVIDAIDGIVASSPDSVIIVFSDHGSRSNAEVDGDWYASFFAARTPDHPGVFPDDARPIDLFPRLLGAYFGDDIEIPDDRDYFAPSGTGMPLDIRPRPLADGPRP